MSAPASRSPPPAATLPAPYDSRPADPRRALVGRGTQLRALRDRAGRLCHRTGSVVVVTGEAGIGKSRLVDELLVELGASPGAVHTIVGACPPIAGTDLPYAAILQGLRQLSRGLTADERARVAAGWPPEVADLVRPPTAATSRDRRGDTAQDLPTVLAVSPTAQVRFFEGLLQGLVRLSRDRPVVVVVEDLHWADRSTLDLLAYLAANIRGEPMLLLLTARSDLPRHHPLRRWLAEVCRMPHSSSLELTRLTRTQTADLLGGLIAGPPAPSLVDQVFARADGNPLFTELLLPETRAGTPTLPPLLRDLLSARFAELSDPAQQLLRMASVVGRLVQDELLAQLSSLPADQLDRALRELVDRQILRPAEVGPTLEFRHELIREAAYDEVLPGQRRRLHRALAATLTARPDLSTGGPGELAHHCVAAADWDNALPAEVAAGLAAEKTFAFAEALHHLRSAAQIWDRVPDAVRRSPLPRHALLARAAQAADLVGEGGMAVDLVGQALAAADPAELPVVAQLHERCGTYHFNAGHAESARTAFTTALTLLPAQPPSAERARVLASLALLDMAWTRLADAGHAAHESIRLARAVGASREEGRASNALGVVTAYAGDLDAGVAYLQAAVRLAQTAQDTDDLAAATINLGHVLGVAGRYEEAVATCLEGYNAAQRLGLGREHGSFLLANAAECLIRAGRWDEADRLLADAVAQTPRGLRAFPVLMQTAWSALRRGRYAAAAEQLAGARTLLDGGGGGPSGWRREMLEAAAELSVWQGSPTEAGREVDEGLTLAEEADEQRFAGPLVASGLRAAADEGEQARARRDLAGAHAAQDAAARLWARARRLDPCPVAIGSGVLPETAALVATCHGERGRLAGEPDAPAWQRAAEAWRALGRPYEAAYARWREADARFVGGEEVAGTAALRAAYDVAHGLGAGGLVEEMTALARGRRVPLEAVAVVPVTGAQDRLGLTPREAEVLARVTAGQSNRQIGEALFISVKTASVHVSNILRKLDVAHREDAARIGRQLGLGPPRG